MWRILENFPPLTAIKQAVPYICSSMGTPQPIGDCSSLWHHHHTYHWGLSYVHTSVFAKLTVCLLLLTLVSRCPQLNIDRCLSVISLFFQRFFTHKKSTVPFFRIKRLLDSSVPWVIVKALCFLWLPPTLTFLGLFIPFCIILFCLASSCISLLCLISFC